MSEQRLFISHASEDSAIAGRIVAYLEARGTPCWISSRDIPPRAIYADAIAEAMQTCSACAVIVSAASNASKAVKRELELASHNDKAFIPIRIDATEPGAGVDYYLRNTQWLDFKRDGERALDRIVGQGAASATGRAPRAPEPAQTSGGLSGSTLAIVALVLLLLAGAGVYFAMGGRRGPETQIAQGGGDVDLAALGPLLGAYHWEGVACGAGPSVTLEGDVLVFAMAGTPTYRHAVESTTDGVVRTRVLEPAEERGKTYAFHAGAGDDLAVTVDGQTDVWSRCPAQASEQAQPEAPIAPPHVESVADAAPGDWLAGVWTLDSGTECASFPWRFRREGNQMRWLLEGARRHKLLTLGADGAWSDEGEAFVRVGPRVENRTAAGSVNCSLRRA